MKYFTESRDPQRFFKSPNDSYFGRNFNFMYCASSSRTRCCMLCVCHTTPTLKLFCLHVFRQAGSPQRVDCLAPKQCLLL